MSVWHTIKDPDDVDLSLDGKTLDVLFKSDNSGNHYVEIPIEFVRRCTGRDQLVCNCGKTTCAKYECKECRDD
jgi:hypothetical protein